MRNFTRKFLCYFFFGWSPFSHVGSILHCLLLNHFKGGPLTSLSSVESVNNVRFYQLLLAYYRILKANRELPRCFLWPSAPLARLIESDLEHGIRVLAICCYSLQAGMAEAERIKLERRVIGEPFTVDFSIPLGQNMDGTTNEVDGWMLPVVELRRVQEEREEIVTQLDDFYSHEANEVARIQDFDLRFANHHSLFSDTDANSVVGLPMCTEYSCYDHQLCPPQVLPLYPFHHPSKLSNNWLFMYPFVSQPF